jgi:hypothetical protein
MGEVEKSIGARRASSLSRLDRRRSATFIDTPVSPSSLIRLVPDKLE